MTSIPPSTRKNGTLAIIIFTTGWKRATGRTYRYSPRNRKFELLPLKEDVIRSFNIADDADWATYTGVSTSNSNRSYLLNLRTMESTLISDPYADRLAKLDLGEVKDWDFISTYGDRIEGRYYLPRIRSQ